MPQNTRIRNFAQSLKRLNLFKASEERTENSIKQQKIITRVYLLLLAGMITSTAHFSIISKDKQKCISKE